MTSPANSAELVHATVDRAWQLRREAERHPGWHKPGIGIFAAVGFAVIAGAELFRAELAPRSLCSPL